ncbi:hypothetical protein [Sphingomonas sp. VNH70]|uniref:hypothetical protein n=1 Tax=Sphingomonas silueang TaxID=3156617 RepID=UPI0032B47697
MTKGIDLGLGDLSDIQPTAREGRSPTEQRRDAVAVDNVGREHGFSKPATPANLPRRQKSAYAGEQLHQVSVKGPVSVMARFVEYCDRERLPYWQAIERLMDKADG